MIGVKSNQSRYWLKTKHSVYSNTDYQINLDEFPVSISINFSDFFHLVALISKFICLSMIICKVQELQM